tara:strand:- start:15 stop:503 length:489 start_codon:yes stop_codon:yes gene_type:complete
MTTIDEIISEMQALKQKAVSYDKLVIEMRELRQKAASYDKLVKDLVTVIDECHYRLDKDRLLPQTSTKVPKIRHNYPTPQDKKYHALWKCKECGTFNVRTSKLISLSPDEVFIFTDEIQSPCPNCGYRQRLHPKNTRLYADKVEANRHKDFFQKHNAIEWLD